MSLKRTFGERGIFSFNDRQVHGDSIASHESTNTLHLHVSVHLPYKSTEKRAKAKLAVEKVVNEQIDEGIFDSVFLHGDFNQKQTNLKQWKFNYDMNFAVTGGDLETTKKGGQTDNVIAELHHKFKNMKLDYESDYSHHPLTVAVTVEK